jgi:hypothetical protein
VNRRLGSWLALSSTLALACGQREQAQAEAPRLEFDAALGGRFDTAVAGLEVAAVDPPESALRWQAPSCELEYQLRVTIDIELVGEETSLPSSGLRIVGGWTARADGARMLLRNGDLNLSHVQAGIQRPSNGQPAGTLAEIRLETNGSMWTEVDGPTSLWSAFGSWSGLTLFHPAIPEATTPGAGGLWPLLLHERGAGVRVEVERGSLEVPEGYEFTEPQTQTIPARVELQRWISIAGTPAVVLRSRYEIGENSPFSGFGMLGGLIADERSEAQYVVLDSGVLLHAELHEQTNVKMSVGIGKTMHQLHTLTGEARLVRGCAGPVLPRFPDERTPSERALELVVALRQHAVSRELEPLAAMIDPELLTAHPEVAGCLAAATERFGWRALGTPELPMLDDIRTEGAAVTMRLSVRLIGESEDDTDSGEVELGIVVEGTQARLASLELRRFGDDTPLLRLHASQPLIAAAGCTAPSEPPAAPEL